MTANSSTFRRFFRFRLWALLLLPLLFALGWWWVTWPKRTLARFDALVAANKLGEAAALIQFEPNYRYPPNKVSEGLGQPHVRRAKRGLADLIVGRQPFEIYDKGVAYWVDTDAGFQHIMLESVTIQYGQIKFKWGLTIAEWIKQGK
jgi:hypothetical protein